MGSLATPYLQQGDVLLTSVTVTDVSVTKSNTEACVADVQTWCAPRRLQLNPSKTEVVCLEPAVVFSNSLALTST